MSQSEKPTSSPRRACYERLTREVEQFIQHTIDADLTDDVTMYIIDAYLDGIGVTIHHLHGVTPEFLARQRSMAKGLLRGRGLCDFKSHHYRKVP